MATEASASGSRSKQRLLHGKTVKFPAGSHILEWEELREIEYSWMSSKKRSLYALKNIEMRMFGRRLGKNK